MPFTLGLILTLAKIQGSQGPAIPPRLPPLSFVRSTLANFRLKQRRDRAEVVRRLIARAESLTEAEQEQLFAFGDLAFKAILGELRDIDSQCRSASPGEQVSALDSAGPLCALLAKWSDSRHWTDIANIAVEMNPQVSSGWILLELLISKADPSISIPACLESLKNFPPDGSDLRTRAVVQSSRPDAVSYTMRILKDPLAPGDVRHEAYLNLARTGGVRGLELVLSMRRQRSKAPPLEERLGLSDLRRQHGRHSRITTLLNVRSDSHGKTWALLRSELFGDPQDLWIVERVKGRWAHPLFVGLGPELAAIGDKASQALYRGKTIDEIRGGAWVEVFTDDPSLRIDSDHDGLTDRMEARMGTDPQRADTDGDGWNDAEDPWPLVRPRKLSASEKALAAAFEACYHFTDSPTFASVTFPGGTPPFEMPGWPGQVVNNTIPAVEGYLNWVVAIDFWGDHRRSVESGLDWSKDRRTVTVSISTSPGFDEGYGFRVVLRKFGNAWVPVSGHLLWVA